MSVFLPVQAAVLAGEVYAVREGQGDNVINLSVNRPRAVVCENLSRALLHRAFGE